MKLFQALTCRKSYETHPLNKHKKYVLYLGPGSAANWCRHFSSKTENGFIRQIKMFPRIYTQTTSTEHKKKDEKKEKKTRRRLKEFIHLLLFSCFPLAIVLYVALWAPRPYKCVFVCANECVSNVARSSSAFCLDPFYIDWFSSEFLIFSLLLLFLPSKICVRRSLSPLNRQQFRLKQCWVIVIKLNLLWFYFSI